jgi:hypothetical protein
MLVPFEISNVTLVEPAARLLSGGPIAPAIESKVSIVRRFTLRTHAKAPDCSRRAQPAESLGLLRRIYIKLQSMFA